MTETTTATTGAETATATDAGAGTSTTSTTEQNAGGQAGGDSIEALQAQLAATKADAEKWKALSRTNESHNKARAEALKKVSAMLGLENEEAATGDPAVVTAKLEAAERASKGAAREVAVLRTAARLGANGDELLDSRSFLARIDALEPGDTAGIKAAIEAAVKESPTKYGAQGATAGSTNGQQQGTQQQAAASTAGSFNNGTGGARQWTKADVDRATPAELKKAMKDGLVDAFLAS